jgi:hypothetical protein
MAINERQALLHNRPPVILLCYVQLSYYVLDLRFWKQRLWRGLSSGMGHRVVCTSPQTFRKNVLFPFLPCMLLAFLRDCSSAQKMEAVRSSETTVNFYWPPRRHMMLLCILQCNYLNITRVLNNQARILMSVWNVATAQRCLVTKAFLFLRSGRRRWCWIGSQREVNKGCSSSLEVGGY